MSVLVISFVDTPLNRRIMDDKSNPAGVSAKSMTTHIDRACEGVDDPKNAIVQGAADGDADPVVKNGALEAFLVGLCSMQRLRCCRCDGVKSRRSNVNDKF